MQYIKTNRLICNNTLPRTKTFIVKVSAKPFTFQVLDLKLEKCWWLASYVNCTTLCLEVDRHRYESWLLPYHQRKKCKTNERHTKVVYSTKENETYSSLQVYNLYSRFNLFRIPAMAISIVSQCDSTPPSETITPYNHVNTNIKLWLVWVSQYTFCYNIKYEWIFIVGIRYKTQFSPTIYTHAREYISSTKLEQLIPRLEKCCISVRSQWSLHICCIPTMTEFETILHKLSFAEVYVK